VLASDLSDNFRAIYDVERIFDNIERIIISKKDTQEGDGQALSVNLRASTGGAVQSAGLSSRIVR
jgi:hypothetical protein